MAIGSRITIRTLTKNDVASLGGWENTEILNKCYDWIPEHIKAQIAKSVHIKFDTMNLNNDAVVPGIAANRPF